MDVPEAENWEAPEAEKKPPVLTCSPTPGQPALWVGSILPADTVLGCPASEKRHAKKEANDTQLSRFDNFKSRAAELVDSDLPKPGLRSRSDELTDDLE